MNQYENENSSSVVEKVKIKKQPMWNVIFHNDNYTPMDFVIQILQILFKKNEQQAYEITMKVQVEGKAIVAQYNKEIADTKRYEVMQLATRYEHPLRCTIEQAPEVTPRSSMKP